MRDTKPSKLSRITDELLNDGKMCQIDPHVDTSNFKDEDKTLEINNNSPIQDFYKDQTIFITGATGFLGTLLVEKLLRCCPQIQKLILLVRERGSDTVEDRVRDYFNDEIFDCMRLANPKYAEKVDIVVGQLDADKFGLTPNDERLLASQTSVVFHIAATVRFDEHIRTAHNINVQGTQTAIALAKKMPHLKSFVYVSTAYSNCDHDYIEEKFYLPTFTADELSILMNRASDEELSILKTHLISRKPNTYTFTKAIAEELVREVSNDLPICVFRPSIVFPTLQEPIPLWMKGFNGPIAMGLAAMIGLLRVSFMKKNKLLDIVPADRTINAMTALAWYQTLIPHQTSLIPQSDRAQYNVFNYVSSSDNEVHQTYLVDLTEHAYNTNEESCNKVLWKQSTIKTGSLQLYHALYYIFHIIPAIVFSCAEKLTHRKPVIMKYYRKIFFLIDVLAYFISNEWQFDNHNTRAMIASMAVEDRHWCDPSVSNFRWESMFVNLPRSMSKYLLKEPLTKEHYKTKMIYIIQACFCFQIIVRAVTLYFFLSFVSHFLNFYLISK